MTRRERTAVQAFLLTRQWKDGPEGVEIVLWAASDAGPVRAHWTHEEAVCFVDRTAAIPPDLVPPRLYRREAVALRGLADGRPVDALYFRSQHRMVEAAGRLKAEGVRVYESDLKPADRYLMERFVTGGVRLEGVAHPHGGFLELVEPKIRPERFRPRLRVVSVDIETGDFDGALYSIAVTEAGRARVFLRDAASWSPAAREALAAVDRHRIHLTLHADERALLTAFFQWLGEYDPDVLIGWNVVAFDLDFLERRARRLRVPFALGRGGETAAILPASGPAQKPVARVPGRVVLDGIDVLRAATWSFEDYRLESVARELLGRGKRIDEAEDEDRLGAIRRLYREAPAELVAYNVEDCRLVEEIFERARLVDFALERAELTGLPLDRVGGSVAAFDHLYLPRLHRRGYVAPDVGDAPLGGESPGGYVMDAKPGLYENVLVLDFKSLYPSIIRSFCIDPLGMHLAGEDGIPGYGGARFAREGHILPGLVAELARAREEAKARGDAPLARAIKIIMNSFYGVLGSPGCRFSDPRLAGSITQRGREILRRSRERIEAAGYTVLYGDTDSLFVLLGPGPSEDEARRIGEELVRSLNAHWRKTLAAEHGVDSHLEIELETHFLRFFLPTIRGSDKGSKKRYAGLVRTGSGVELRFTGLESVRSDWTPLARRFQRELYRRIFQGEPFEPLVRETAAALRAGRLDRELVYRKRLRRSLAEYAKGAPPHVQAARKSRRAGRWVRYVMTTNGPEPVDARRSPLDYDHYVERQLAPAADAILQLKGTSVKKILDAQRSLF